MGNKTPEELEIAKYGATEGETFFFLSFPYGSSYQFPNIKQLIDYLVNAEKLAGSYNPRIITGHVGTSYGRPYIKNDKTTKKQLKGYLQAYKYTKEQIKRVLGRL